MTTFPETLNLGQVISREIKEEIERRYNTYAELERQLAVSEQARMEADELVLKQNAQLAEQAKQIMMLRDDEVAHFVQED